MGSTSQDYNHRNLTEAARACDELAELLGDAQKALRRAAQGMRQKASHIALAFELERVPTGTPLERAEQIVKIVAGATDFVFEELIGPNRTKGLVRARQCAMWLVRMETDLSYPVMGRLFGGRDHTTVMHSVQQIDGLRRQDAALRIWLDQFRQALGRGPEHAPGPLPGTSRRRRTA